MLNGSVYSDVGPTYMYHDETSAMVAGPPEEVFAHMDDHARLTSHMSESSWMMGRGSMQVELDAARGQKIGSWIRLSGKILGVTLAVEEIVTERTPPRRKAWETTGVPRLLVIGRYRMGFRDCSAQPRLACSRLYRFCAAEGTLTRWLGYFSMRDGARREMLNDAVRQFASSIYIYE